MMEENYTPGNDSDEPVIGDAPPTSKTLFSNAVYDKLKWVALIFLPALAVLYLGLAPLWDLPKQEEVTATIVLVDTFLGALLGLSTKQYNNSDAAYDGRVVVVPNEAEGTTNTHFQIDPTALETGQKQLRLKIKRNK